MKRFCTACLTFLLIAALAAVTVFAAMDSYTDGYMSITLDDGRSIEIGVGSLYTDDSYSGSASTNTVSVEGFTAYDAYVRFQIDICNDEGESDYMSAWNQSVTFASASADLSVNRPGFHYAGVSSSHSSSVVSNSNSSDIRGDSINLSL